MQHFIYPEQQYKCTYDYGTLKIDHDLRDDLIRVIIIDSSGSRMIRLPAEAAARVAGFMLSKHPAIVKGDAMAFSGATRACDAIPEPGFTVITPGHELLAKPKEPDTKDDEQDIGDLHPDQERRLTALREANEILGGRLYHDQLIECAEWILAGNDSTN